METKKILTFFEKKYSQTPLPQRLAEIEAAVADGATEIDIGALFLFIIIVFVA